MLSNKIDLFIALILTHSNLLIHIPSLLDAEAVEVGNTVEFVALMEATQRQVDHNLIPHNNLMTTN